MVDIAGKDESNHPGFNYCFWSKLMVAIVLFPVVAFIAASFFTNIIFKILAACLVIAFLVYASIVIDHIPFLTQQTCLIGKRKTK